MELKIEDLKVGDELVCVCNKQRVFEVGEVKTVSEVGDRFILFAHSFIKYGHGVIRYFKKKEQSQQYTFDDLIDVAVQAYKDGVATVKIDTKLHTVFVEELKTTYGIGHIDLGIKNIQSLYKETFVIETEEDLDRFNKDVEITLANDEKLSWEDLKSIGLMNTHAIFKALKGATVTQSK